MSDAMELSEEIQHSIDGFKWAKEEVLVLTKDLTADQFNWRPAEGQWSVGECLEHLNETGYHFFEAMETAIDEGNVTGQMNRGPFRYSWFGNWFAIAAGVQADPNKGKVKAPKLYCQSASTLDPTETIERFRDLQDMMIGLLPKAQGLDLKRIKVSSPAMKLLRLSLGVWIKMLPDHQRRHFQQAQRVKDAMPD